MAFKDTPEPYVVPAPHRPTQIEFLASESPQEFADLRALWFGEYAADDEPFEVEIVQRIAEADWRRLRWLRHRNQLEAHLFATAGEAWQWTEKHYKLQTLAQRQYEAALRELEVLRRQLNQQKHSRYRQICVEFQATLAIAKSRQYRKAAEKKRCVEFVSQNRKSPTNSSRKTGNAHLQFF